LPFRCRYAEPAMTAATATMMARLAAMPMRTLALRERRRRARACFLRLSRPD